jgi:tryptophan synthase alpha chain
MAGHPDRETTRLMLEALPEAGADIIEIGVPFSDPMADGPVIQAAGQKALLHHTSLQDALDFAAACRKRHEETPILLMGYYNPVYRYGTEAFCAAAAAAGVDGFILVDLPPEEEEEVTRHSRARALALIRLITPTSDARRLDTLLADASGFLYYVAVAGVTGTKSADAEALGESLALLRRRTSLPVAVGFGINTPDQARHCARHADAVVVGSALVKRLEEGMESALSFVRSLRAELDKTPPVS